MSKRLKQRKQVAFRGLRRREVIPTRVPDPLSGELEDVFTNSAVDLLAYEHMSERLSKQAFDAGRSLQARLELGVRATGSSVSGKVDESYRSDLAVRAGHRRAAIIVKTTRWMEAQIGKPEARFVRDILTGDATDLIEAQQERGDTPHVAHWRSLMEQLAQAEQKNAGPRWKPPGRTRPH